MSAVDHTSGGQRAAEAEATAEQLAEWERRLRARADELVRELRNLGTAALTHSAPAQHIAHAARLAAETLTRGAQAYDDEQGYGPPIELAAAEQEGAWPYDQEGVTHTLDRELQWGQSSTHGAVLMGATETRSLITPDRGDQPPFAAELVVDRPPDQR